MDDAKRLCDPFCVVCDTIGMNFRLLGIALAFALYSGSSAFGQCAIQPIKPIPPLGCKDLTPQCVTDNSGHASWTWACVPSANDPQKPTFGGRSLGFPSPKPRSPVPVLPPEPVQAPPLAPPADPFQEPSVTNAASTKQMDAEEQQAIEQLRAIAEGIKTCNYDVPGLVDPLAPLGFKFVFGPPENVVWDVISQPSVRAPYKGFVEYSVPAYEQLPPTDKYCNNPKVKKTECKRMWVIGTQIYERQVNHPRQIRYEFDISDRGLEFLRAFKKTQQTDDEQWVAAGIEADGCAQRSIRSAFKSPTR